MDEIVCVVNQSLDRLDDQNMDLSDIRQACLNGWLYDPKTILQNIILMVSTIGKRNIETIRKLDFAMRFVKIWLNLSDNTPRITSNTSTRC